MLHSKRVCTTLLLPAGRCFGPLFLLLFFVCFSVVLQVIKKTDETGQDFSLEKKTNT